MARNKILWLCSWYPSKYSPFNGDFIQRHAKAASLFNDIYVLHLYGAPGIEQEEEIRKEGNLTEQIIYYKKPSSVAGKVIGQYRWFSLYRNAIREYISKHGRPDLVHVHVPMKDGIFAMWARKKYGIPYVVTEHWGIYNKVEKLNYLTRSDTFKKYTKDIIVQSSAFTSPSAYLADGVNRYVVRKAYTIIPNAVDTRLFHYVSSASDRNFTFIHVSNMAALKNVEGILRAFSKLREKNEKVSLVIVGDAHPQLRIDAIKNGLGYGVEFKGEVPYETVASEMKKADAFVLFSDIENSPCVIGEALCCGLPVISSRVGGVPELVDDSNSLLVPARDEVALLKAMEEMINSSSKYDHDAIATKAKNRFSYEKIGKQFDEVYEKLMNW